MYSDLMQKRQSENPTKYFSNNNDPQPLYGVGIIVEMISKKRNVNLIQIYFNSKVGEDKTEGCTGGLGIRNERRDRLIEFCQKRKCCYN